MSRKPKKGYYVRGEFVPEGSEQDLAYKRELRGSELPSKTELKRESTLRQDLGVELLELRSDLRKRLLEQGHLNEALLEALQEAKKITNFEGKRRQMQYVGKLMRKLDDEDVHAIEQALHEQHAGSAQLTQALHLAEDWRDRLLQNEDALTQWMALYPQTDGQALRSLIRQAQKDDKSNDAHALSQGKAPRHSKTYREIFQLIREVLQSAQSVPAPAPAAAPGLTSPN